MRVHFFSHQPSVAPNHGTPPERVLSGLTGGNTGNQLFISALARQVAPGSEATTFGYRFDPDELNANAGLIVIPAANWLAKGNDFSRWGEALRPTRVPILIAGLGAQANLGGGIPELSEGTLSFIRLVAERTTAIGTRGDFSTAVLAHYGIHNARTVGCPTLYSHGRPDFPQVREVKALSPDKVVIQATKHEARPNAIHRPGAAANQRRLLAVAQASQAHYVLQSEQEEVLLTLGGQLPEEARERLLTYYEVDHLDALQPFLQRMRVFLNVDDWMAFLATMHFVCGSRIHGVIASLLAGTPAVLFAHDSRTAEMAAFAGLPQFELEAFLALAERAGAMEAVAQVAGGCAMDRFSECYPENYARYRQFLEDNGVRHRLA